MEGMVFLVIGIMIFTWIVYKLKSRTKKLGRKNMPYSYQKLSRCIIRN